jgi:glycosyl transferase / beta-hydroxylase protein BlmF
VSGPRISLLCPTRNRPGNVRRLLRSARSTAEGPLEFVFRTDEDAPLDAMLAAKPDVVEVNGPRITMSDMWNACWRAASADVFMMCCDEVVFRTPGWDEQVLGRFAEFPDRIVLVFGNDLFHPAGDGVTLPFVHRAWTDAVGYFTPPYFGADFADVWLDDLAKRVGRREYVPVVTEHMHPAAGKSLWDQTHQERLARLAAQDPRGVYEQKAPERESDARKLADAMAAGVMM